MTPRCLAQLTVAIAHLQAAKRQARLGVRDLAHESVQQALLAASRAQNELTPRTLLEVFSEDDASELAEEENPCTSAT